MITDLPENIQQTFRILELSDTDADKFIILTNKIHEYLKSKKTKYILDVDTFVDQDYPDYPGSVLVELNIRIPEKNYQVIYNDIKMDVYNTVEKNASAKLMNLIVILIEPDNSID